MGKVQNFSWASTKQFNGQKPHVFILSAHVSWTKYVLWQTYFHVQSTMFPRANWIACYITACASLVWRSRPFRMGKHKIFNSQKPHVFILSARFMDKIRCALANIFSFCALANIFSYNNTQASYNTQFSLPMFPRANWIACYITACASLVWRSRPFRR